MSVENKKNLELFENQLESTTDNNACNEECIENCNKMI